MPERNSEKRLTWAVVAIIGCQLLGIDVQQIIGILTEAQQQVATASSGQAGGLLGGDLSLPALVGLYVWRRTQLKALRESAPKEEP